MNNPIYRNDGTLKASFFKEARQCLTRSKSYLVDFKNKYATIMRLDSPVAGSIREVKLMLAVVAQLELDQTEDAKLQKAKDAKLLAAGFPTEKTPFEKMRGKYLKDRKD